MSFVPEISIIISVHNAEATLERCLKSIAEQTFTNYEIIAVDDASTDRSYQILTRWRDTIGSQRFLLQKNQENIGLTKSLNQAMTQARGEIIARIDADDWWVPSKLETQTNLLKAHLEYGVVGSWYFNVRQSATTAVKLPVTDEAIRHSIFQKNPFGHSCVLIRHQLLKDAAGYQEHLYVGQDRDLWFRLLPQTKFYNIPEFLCYRQAGSGISVIYGRRQMWQEVKTKMKYIHRFNAPKRHYLSLWEPVLLILMPLWLKKCLRYFKKNAV